MSSANPPKTFLYMLYNEINYNSLCKEYYNILTLNKQPEGPLKEHTKTINITIPSTSETYNKQCTIAIENSVLTSNTSNTSNNKYNKHSNLLMLEDLNDLTEFLINNNNINSKKLLYIFKITL